MVEGLSEKGVAGASPATTVWLFAFALQRDAVKKIAKSKSKSRSRSRSRLGCEIRKVKFEGERSSYYLLAASKTRNR